MLIFTLPSFAQTYEEGDMDVPPLETEEYRESALRRFEIVFTISIPFTALHSYIAVRGVESIRQGKISPDFQSAHWNVIGGLTILFSGFVGFWDWLHTRDEEISEIPIKPREPIELYSGYSMPNTAYSKFLARYSSFSTSQPELRLISFRF
jgi:hypothetical protein